MAVLIVSVMVVGLFHPGIATAQSCSGSNYQGYLGNDQWGDYGCINTSYQCPSGGSWRNRDAKCDCLPQSPIWDEFHKQCRTVFGGFGDPSGKIGLSLFHQSEHTNLCINDPYQSTDDYTPLVVNDGHCDFGDPASVIFVENRQSTTRVLIRSEFFCMDNSNSRQEESNPIILYHCNDTDAQKWDFDDYKFHYHANPNFCLSVAWDTDNPNNGGHLVLASCIDQGNFKFLEEYRAFVYKTAPGWGTIPNTTAIRAAGATFIQNQASLEADGVFPWGCQISSGPVNGS
jgi:hypothetical protein